MNFEHYPKNNTILRFHFEIKLHGKQHGFLLGNPSIEEKKKRQDSPNMQQHQYKYNP